MVSTFISLSRAASTAKSARLFRRPDRFVGATGNAFNDWNRLAEQLHELESADSDRNARLELLRFQISEMDALDLQPDEFEALSQERGNLQNSGRLAEGVNLTLQRLFDADEGNAQSLLAEPPKRSKRLRN